jgi:hypothetical protein
LHRPRTLDQLRADLFVDAVLTGLSGQLPTKHGLQPNIGVIVSLETLAGVEDEPAWLDGYGPVIAQTARELASDETGTWRRLILDPIFGQVIDYGTTRYRPPKHLTELDRPRGYLRIPALQPPRQVLRTGSCHSIPGRRYQRREPRPRMQTRPPWQTQRRLDSPTKPRRHHHLDQPPRPRIHQPPTRTVDPAQRRVAVRPGVNVARVTDLAVLRAQDLLERLQTLGFRPDDAAATVTATQFVLGDSAVTETVSGMADILVSHMGAFLSDSTTFHPLLTDTSTQAGLGNGVLPLLALVATVPEIRAFHVSRGISSDISQATLADLGRNVWIHRRTHGTFGLETHKWLTLHWRGALYQLGRLQFDLGRIDPFSRWARALPEGVKGGDWAPGVHIPEAGALGIEATTASLDQLKPFLSKHFPEVEARMVHCRSWLLDPYLRQVLPGSNVGSFQQLFTLDGTSEANNEDTVYFTFRQRGLDRLDELPRDTRLQRAVLDRIHDGGHWHLTQGWREI